MDRFGICLLTLPFYSSSLALSQDLFSPVRLTSDSTREGFPTWSPDGSAIISSFFDLIDGTASGGLLQIDVAGRSSKLLTRIFAEHPDWSPDGRQIVFDANMGDSVRILHLPEMRLRPVLPESLRIQSGSLPQCRVLHRPNRPRRNLRHEHRRCQVAGGVRQG
jgi:hypothetical protein